MVTVRIGLLALACAFLLSACGDSPLADFGVTEEWLGDRGDGAAGFATTVPVRVNRPIETLIWYNPWADSVDPDPAVVIESIWERSSGTDAFVQAAANEISVAIPGIKVPRVLPPETSYVTSQIVYGVSTGRLTNAYVAAFGFWKSEPYVSSRSVSQLLQLKVAEDDADPAPAADDASLGCNRFNNRDITSCDPTSVSAARAWWITTLDGPVLVWYDSGFRYELLDRQKFGREALVDLASSMILLRDVDAAEQTDP